MNQINRELQLGQTAANVTTIEVHEAEIQLLQLLALALKGDKVVITKDNIPLAQIVPINNQCKRRVAGLHKGALRMQPDFNAPILDVFGIAAE